MGIKIHKALGWVLENEVLEFDDENETKLKDIIKKNEEDLLLSLEISFGLNLEDDIIRFVNDLEEWANRPFYLFIPPAEIEAWSRYNSSIDYYDCESAGFTVKHLHKEIYPYHSPFVLTENLKELSRAEVDLISITNGVNLEKTDLKIEEKLSKIGLDLSKPRLNQIHQTAPKVIQAIAKSMGLEDTRKLRPAIITYWA